MELLERVSRLERSARRWRLVSVGLGLGLAFAVLSAAQKGPERFTEVHAERFIVDDEDGKPLIQLERTKFGANLQFNRRRPGLPPSVTLTASPAGDATLYLTGREVPSGFNFGFEAGVLCRKPFRLW